LRLPYCAHQAGVAVGSRRVQLPLDGRATVGDRRGDSLPHRGRVERGNGLANVQARRAWYERVRARGWRRLSQLLGIRARAGRPLGHVPMARPRATGSQRDRLLVAPPRRVRQPLTRAERCATDLTAAGAGLLGPVASAVIPHASNTITVTAPAKKTRTPRAWQ